MSFTTQELRQTLEADRKYKAPELAKKVIKYDLESALFKLAMEKDPVLSNRAMWVLWHCSIIDYTVVKPFLNKLIMHLDNKNATSGVVRCILSLFQEKPVPEKHHSFMLDKCFAYITNSAEAIAVRAFAMTVAFNISKQYPELLSELEAILRHLPIQEESPGIRTRTKNTLKQIEQFRKNLK